MRGKYLHWSQKVYSNEDLETNSIFHLPNTLLYKNIIYMNIRLMFQEREFSDEGVLFMNFQAKIIQIDYSDGAPFLS